MAHFNLASPKKRRNRLALLPHTLTSPAAAIRAARIANMAQSAGASPALCAAVKAAAASVCDVGDDLEEREAMETLPFSAGKCEVLHPPPFALLWAPSVGSEKGKGKETEAELHITLSGSYSDPESASPTPEAPERRTLAELTTTLHDAFQINTALPAAAATALLVPGGALAAAVVELGSGPVPRDLTAALAVAAERQPEVLGRWAAHIMSSRSGISAATKLVGMLGKEGVAAFADEVRGTGGVPVDAAPALGKAVHRGAALGCDIDALCGAVLALQPRPTGVVGQDRALVSALAAAASVKGLGRSTKDALLARLRQFPSKLPGVRSAIKTLK